MSKFKLGKSIIIYTLVAIGFYLFSMMARGMAPQLSAQMKRNTKILKTHQQEYKMNISNSSTFINLDNIAFNIINKEVHNGQLLMDINIDTTKFANYKTLDKYEYAGELPFANVTASVIMKDDFDKYKEPLLKEQFMQDNVILKFHQLAGRPNQYNNSQIGYFFSKEKLENTIRYNQINHFQLIILDPNVKMVKLSVCYNVEESLQTHTYILLKE